MNGTKPGPGGPGGNRPQPGPQARRYDPSEGPQQKFKGGEKPEKPEICKKRYQQIAITALGDIGSNTTARILQTAPVYTMTLEVGTTTFSSAFSSLASFAFAAVVLALSFAF